MTWADLTYYSFFILVTEKFPDALKDAPHFKEMMKKVETIPSIKKWIESRPVDASLKAP